MEQPRRQREWDGFGYPDGLKGEEIPLGARILYLADSLDAMLSTRPFRGARGYSEVMQEVAGCVGTEFVYRAVQLLKVRDVNAATLRMFGARSKAELLDALDKVFLPETMQLFREGILAMAEGQTFFEGETINGTLHGERLNVVLTMTIPQEVEEFGSMLVSMLDITERVRAEKELRKSQADLLDLYENAPNAYFSVGLDGRNRMCNKRALVTCLGIQQESSWDSPWLNSARPCPMAGTKRSGSSSVSGAVNP